MIEAHDSTANNKIKSSEEINRAIIQLRLRSNRIKIAGLSGQNSLAVGLQGNVELHLNGNVGKYFGALNNGAVITLNGNSGPYTGDRMANGGIIILGGSDRDAGMNLKGGILVIKGKCGGNAGNFMTGGTIIIDGDVNGDVGDHMSNGTLIVNGEINGKILEHAIGGTIYSSSSLVDRTDNLNEMRLSGKDRDLLGSYFKHYAIDALPTSFRKYVISKSSIMGWRPW
ncbi:MAG: hypothetical protein KAH57_04160 [Thermoplasmata archaeon]|nr:hypothetical protein [Thermoplasmata archaeon]